MNHQISSYAPNASGPFVTTVGLPDQAKEVRDWFAANPTRNFMVKDLTPEECIPPGMLPAGCTWRAIIAAKVWFRGSM